MAIYKSTLKLSNTNFSYLFSDKPESFVVDSYKIEDEINAVTPLIPKKQDVNVRISNGVLLLLRLKMNGLIKMDILNLVRDYSVEEIGIVIQDCYNQMGKFGYSVKEVEIKNKIARIWNFEKIPEL